MQRGRLRPHPGGGGTIRRPEAERLRRVCAGDLNKVDHDRAFGGVARWDAPPEVSLSHPLVGPLPGEVGLLVGGGGGAVGAERSSCLRGRRARPGSEEVGRPRPLLGRSPATPQVVPSIGRKSLPSWASGSVSAQGREGRDHGWGERGEWRRRHRIL